MVTDTVAEKLRDIVLIHEQDLRNLPPPSLRRIIVSVTELTYRDVIVDFDIKTAGAHRRSVELYRSIAREQGFYDVGQDEDIRTVSSQDQKRTMAILFSKPPDSAKNTVGTRDLRALRIKFMRARRDWYERTSGTGVGCWI